MEYIYAAVAIAVIAVIVWRQSKKPADPRPSEPPPAKEPMPDQQDQ